MSNLNRPQQQKEGRASRPHKANEKALSQAELEAITRLLAQMTQFPNRRWIVVYHLRRCIHELGPAKSGSDGGSSKQQGNSKPSDLKVQPKPPQQRKGKKAASRQNSARDNSPQVENQQQVNPPVAAPLPKPPEKIDITEDYVLQQYPWVKSKEVFGTTPPNDWDFIRLIDTIVSPTQVPVEDRKQVFLEEEFKSNLSVDLSQVKEPFKQIFTATDNLRQNLNKMVSLDQAPVARQIINKICHMIYQARQSQELEDPDFWSELRTKFETGVISTRLNAEKVFKKGTSVSRLLHEMSSTDTQICQLRGSLTELSKAPARDKKQISKVQQQLEQARNRKTKLTEDYSKFTEKFEQFFRSVSANINQRQQVSPRSKEEDQPDQQASQSLARRQSCIQTAQSILGCQLVDISPKLIGRFLLEPSKPEREDIVTRIALTERFDQRNPTERQQVIQQLTDSGFISILDQFGIPSPIKNQDLWFDFKCHSKQLGYLNSLVRRIAQKYPGTIPETIGHQSQVRQQTNTAEKSDGQEPAQIYSADSQPSGQRGGELDLPLEIKFLDVVQARLAEDIRTLRGQGSPEKEAEDPDRGSGFKPDPPE